MKSLVASIPLDLETHHFSKNKAAKYVLYFIASLKAISRRLNLANKFKLDGMTFF